MVAIATADQDAHNELTFIQRDNPIYKGGVTNVLIDETALI